MHDAASSGRQIDSRPHGRGRGRGRGRGQGPDGQTASSGPDSMAPPGNFPVPGGQPAVAAPRTIMIKKRPQPAHPAPD